MINELKLKELCERITEDTQRRLKETNLDCQTNLVNAIAHYHIANKYTRVDIGDSGKYMIVNETGEIYGIKAYGVIHKGHFYGTINTINDYDWGLYTAIAIKKGI